MQEFFFSEMNHYHGGVLTEENWAPAGHYTQAVWNSTTSIGCATASNANAEVLVCRYNPPGNFIGQAPY
jgi:pathogenesis-related protein 1